MGKLKTHDLSTEPEPELFFYPLFEEPARQRQRRDGSERTGKPFPRSAGGATGSHARVPRPNSSGEADEGEGGGDNEDLAPLPAQAPISLHARRIERQSAAFAGQREVRCAAYTVGREELDALGQQLFALDLAHRQGKLDTAIRRHPHVCAVYSAIALEPDAELRSQLLARADTELRVSGWLGDFSLQRVEYVSLRGVGSLFVPTISVDGIKYTPPASDCMCMSSSPLLPVKGTHFFDWALLDFVSYIFLKGGVALSGEGIFLCLLGLLPLYARGGNRARARERVGCGLPM